MDYDPCRSRERSDGAVRHPRCRLILVDMEYAPSGLRLGPYAPPSDEGTGERGIREIDRDRGVNTHAPPIMAYLGTVLFCLGFPDQALARTKAAIAESRRLAHLPSLAVSLSDGARLLSLVEDNPVLGEWVDQLVAVTTEQGFPWWGAQGTIYRGCLEVRNGDVTEGMSLLRRGSIDYRTTGAEVWMPYFIALLANAYEAAEQIEEALTLLEEALEIVERTGERWFAAELHRHKGELLLHQGHTEAAEELYCKALSIARDQEAKMWELRAAVSLARLRRNQGMTTEARELLAPVYGWCTEGFDTPDLKEARALLEALNP